jgi:hypothetical protein
MDSIAEIQAFIRFVRDELAQAESA